MTQQIKNSDKICYNCQYLAWLIGVGQGIRCGHQTKKEEGKIPPLVPSRFHTCDLFEFNIKPKNKEKKT